MENCGDSSGQRPGRTGSPASVSVVIPVFNRAQMVCEAIESALAQIHRPIEIIVVDDGSTDATATRLEQISSRHPDEIRILRQVNSGPGLARNLALSVANGEFVQYLDSDDLLEPTKIEKQVVALQRHPEAGVCYCITMRQDPKTGELKPWARTAEEITDIFPSFLPCRGWATLTPLWRRSVCDRIGPWGSFRVLEDWDHDLRAGMLGVIPVHVPEPLCTVRDHCDQRASGMNTGFTRELTREFFRAHESVWTHMKAHGLNDWDYLARFSRTMFWVARLCGSFGLKEEADAALRYTDEMTQLNARPAATRGMRALKSLIGWRYAAALSEGARRRLKGAR